MKKILLGFIVLGLANLFTSCKKEGGLDGRSKTVTKQLQEKGLFEVYRITGINHQIYLGGGDYGNSYITINFGHRTEISFYPDSSQNLRRRYWSDPWNMYQLGDTQQHYLEYTFLHNLVIRVPAGNKKLVVVKDRDDENLPLIELAGEYQVETGHTFNGRPGYVLRKFSDYTHSKNGIGQPILTIELAEVAR